MQQRVHGEVGALLQVVAIAAPRHRLSVYSRQSFRLAGVQTYADRRLLPERFQIAFEALVTHHLARIIGKSLR